MPTPTPTKWVCNPFASMSVLVTVSVSASMNTCTQFYTTHFFIGVGVGQCEHSVKPSSMNWFLGTRYAYSNFGYLVLGRVVEKVSGQKYENYIQKEFWKSGIYSMKLGHTRKDDRDFSEVRLSFWWLMFCKILKLPPTGKAGSPSVFGSISLFDWTGISLCKSVYTCHSFGFSSLLYAFW